MAPKKRTRKPTERERKVAKELAKGVTVPEAGVKAGYSPNYSRTGLYKSIKRPHVQSIFTDALERVFHQKGIGIDEVLIPFVEALGAKVIVKSQQLGDAQETQFPDHAIRMQAAEKIVDLYGGKPREVDAPAEAAKGLVVVIQREGGSATPTTIHVTGRTEIQPTGTAKASALPVKIERA